MSRPTSMEMSESLSDTNILPINPARKQRSVLTHPEIIADRVFKESLYF